MLHSQSNTIALIIPARNEAESLPQVFKNIPPNIQQVIVVDNGSTDSTAKIARYHGATVVSEPRQGYGQACLAGIAFLKQNPPDLVAFADGDGSDNHRELARLIETLISEQRDLVLAQRIPKNRQALSPQQRFGNGLATLLISLIWGGSYQDLGPMRVMRWDALQQLDMKDCNFGWTIEMQIKALQHTLSIREIPVTYLPRLAGESKISRTAKGVLQAGSKILWVVAREAWRSRGQLFARLLRREKTALANKASKGASQI
ncbi:glycosyltransferase family 2 protein [Desulfuromonas acetoxidans]|uniref:glycosyltransferase family 2 protein n=1 Tax=Desulfuromonas acetoxidans TaxID=891 RepID=UPI002930E4C2|nr:glycosyltransferase family 2 protein [Desulfuromonas acetoxidans]